MKNYKFSIRGNQYEVDILSVEDDVAEIEVNGTTYRVEIQAKKKESKTPVLVRSAVPAPTRKEQKLAKTIGSKYLVKAPLPGTIMHFLVKVGDTVKKGDKLLVMEAMKMENNIMSEKEGVVAAIKVKENDSVLQNDVIMELE